MQQEQRTSLLLLEEKEVQAAIQRLTNGYSYYYGPATSNSCACLLASKQPNKGPEAGWVKCKVGGSKKEYYIHHLALLNANRKIELQGLLQGKQVSHLCHQRTCFNPEHLIVEDAEANRDRTRCKNWKWVCCPCGCNHKFNPCTHSPQCILPKD